MTVLDAQNLLYEWYGLNDSFELNRDIRKIIPIMEDEEECLSAFKLALGELTKNDLIAPQEYGDKNYYILTKSYESYTQTVELTSYTSKWLSGEINEFCELIEDKTDLCSSSNINDKDVRNLVHIIQFYKQKMAEKERLITSLHSGDEEAFDFDGGEKLLKEILGKGDGPNASKKEDNNNDDNDDDDEDSDGKNKKNKKKK